jgi:D-tagatose-1,6-bisphosphate aldolase subunit GatZ/KbaZ
VSVDLQRQLLAGRGASGVYAVCSAHPWVIEAAALQALEDSSLLLVEATSNQVNQDGGYTGMQPADFRRFATDLITGAGLPEDRLVLGGDHLGPNPWSSLPAAEAMDRASRMVELYAKAGFTKIHLDTSMGCADDPAQLDDEVVATRAAQLCQVAERAVAETDGGSPIYIIGTEVPPPGGASHALSHIEVTRADAVERTLQIHRDAFHRAGLETAWERVLGIVVQPGVEFGHDNVIAYDPGAAQRLQGFLTKHPTLVFEAHSTDYQQLSALRELIRDGFSILKVGPGLTFALREALYALAAIESEMLPEGERSNLRETLEERMLARPEFWQRYYPGTEQEQKVLRSFSYSDRIRYYWPDGEIQGAVNRLLANFARIEIPRPLLGQHLPSSDRGMLPGTAMSAKGLVIEHVRLELRKYSAACRPSHVHAAT